MPNPTATRYTVICRPVDQAVIGTFHPETPELEEPPYSVTDGTNEDTAYSAAELAELHALYQAAGIPYTITARPIRWQAYRCESQTAHSPASCDVAHEWIEETWPNTYLPSPQ